MTYKNRPLVRKYNTIYFGSMSDKYIAMIQIASTREVLGETISNKVLIQIHLTDESAPTKDRIVKTAEKVGLYDGLEIADIWLTRMLKS